ncbi:hypothetical protein DFH07DRAFT_782495 [Mycena maculata]|uniref:Uncharacterized protein n=1 Tax=Mycena maculata TaxID=230809 RepID=A0AAD7HU76_9AGAR|nr:hypothetical protein DFH07DRAFT_782495 [Mycena maculata]
MYAWGKGPDVTVTRLIQWDGGDGGNKLSCMELDFKATRWILRHTESAAFERAGTLPGTMAGSGDDGRKRARTNSTAPGKEWLMRNRWALEQSSARIYGSGNGGLIWIWIWDDGGHDHRRLTWITTGYWYRLATVLRHWSQAAAAQWICHQHILGRSRGGTNEKGRRHGHEATVKGESNEPNDAIKARHPQLTVINILWLLYIISDVLASYPVGRLSTKATDAAARKETSAGFRPKDGADKGSGKEKSQKKQDSTGPCMVKVSSFQVIVSGLDSEGDPQNEQCPSPKDVERMLKYGLAVLKMSDGQPLEFAKEWKQKRIDKWFRELAPVVFEFLDIRYPESTPPALHWKLLGKAQRTVFTMNCPDITGAELDEAKGLAGRKSQEHTVRIGMLTESLSLATKHKIPASLYKDFEHAIERLKAGEDLPSESEEESDPRPSKGKGKTKAKQPVRGKSLKAEDSNDSDSDGGLSLKNTDYGSDIEEYFPSHLSGLSRKHSASPSFEPFGSEGGSKRSRRDSASSHRSVTSSNEETTRDSPSPHLRPATSSFQYDPSATSFGSASATIPYSTWTPTWVNPLISSSSVSGPPVVTASTTFGTSMTGTALASTSTSTPAQVGTGSATSPPTASGSSTSALPPVASGSSLLQSHRSSAGATLKKWVPPPPRAGLNVPQPSHNIWS